MVSTSGTARTWRRTGDDGSVLEYRFCPTCGSTVWFTQDVAPDVIAIAIGAFADPSFPAPRRSSYNQSRHGWVELHVGTDAHAPHGDHGRK